MTDDRSHPTAAEIRGVSARLEETYHSVTAIHDLCVQGLAAAGENNEIVSLLVAVREMTRSIARDMENCAQILDANRGGLGYFSSHYGEI
ncbi:hypothetical protein C7410_10834 [Paraburkholderia silvatlantica]|uniref:Uncharacterized protein n=1 Tax=Paraburkholderia silvatlantica TaxID=321895 RepID=A0A2V4TC34_9BURK|nr:hypothetical protein [Paraburkholderia silvatlantica]PYE23139.1 hypothetical protein C7410_10834 [Paraburkholderia silvatlantica]